MPRTIVDADISDYTAVTTITFRTALTVASYVSGLHEFTRDAIITNDTLMKQTLYIVA